MYSSSFVWRFKIYLPNCLKTLLSNVFLILILQKLKLRDFVYNFAFSQGDERESGRTGGFLQHRDKQPGSPLPLRRPDTTAAAAGESAPPRPGLHHHRRQLSPPFP
jgi:hypothetical protein